MKLKEHFYSRSLPREDRPIFPCSFFSGGPAPPIIRIRSASPVSYLHAQHRSLVIERSVGRNTQYRAVSGALRLVLGIEDGA